MVGGIESQVDALNLFCSLMTDDDRVDLEFWKADYADSLLSEDEEEQKEKEPTTEKLFEYALESMGHSMDIVEAAGLDTSDPDSFQVFCDSFSDSPFNVDFDTFASFERYGQPVTIYFQAGTSFLAMRESFYAVFGPASPGFVFVYDRTDDRGIWLGVAEEEEDDGSEDSDDSDEDGSDDSDEEEEEEESSEEVDSDEESSDESIESD
jgi:hypothetical protein